MTYRIPFLAAAGIVVALASAAPAVHGQPANRLTYLTFSGPVSLPGVTLAAGRYAFELADPTTAADIVRVRSSRGKDPVFQGFTLRVERPASTRNKASVALGEAAAGQAAPIVTWYPADGPNGFRFIYR